MNDHILLNKAKYLTSAAQLSQLPLDKAKEIAFIGRSNAGKSSALNAITGIKNLARTSSTPGRTQMINLFEVTDMARLVDLPGYGYANVPRPVSERWQQTTFEYLQTREYLSGLILLMDVRHPFKSLDEDLIAWSQECRLPLHILLTKADKLKRYEVNKALNEVTDRLVSYPDITRQAFSSISKDGLAKARSVISSWLF